jgi:DNA-binding NarL/FixJ family response regulator
MRILIADRRTEVRVALSLLLGQQPGLEVEGEARDSADLLAQAKALCPDVVILDWGLSGLTGTDLVGALHALEPRPRVIVLALREDVREAALAAGADGFASKDESPDQLVTTLRALQSEGACRE